MYWRGLYVLLATMIFIDAHAARNPFQPHLLDIEQNNVNYGYLLELGDDALLARIHLVRNARETIEIQTFIWAPDESGTFMFYELFQAALRGVKVRILVDDLSIRSIPQYVAYLANLDPNIEIKQFNPVADDIEIGTIKTLGKVTTNFTGFNSRMHNKIVLVDGLYGITGGRNYANDYFDRGTERSFLDRDILVIGPAVKDMAASFEEYWANDLAVYSNEMNDVRRQVESEAIETPDIAQGYAIPEIFAKLSDCASTPECVDSRIVAGGIQLDHVKFVADHPEKHEDGDDYAETTESLIELMTNAKQSIILQTPYLVAGKSGNSFFKNIIKNNPEIEFIVSTNSLAAADHFYAYAFSYKNKKKYLRKFRWQIHEMKPEPQDLEYMMAQVPGIERSAKHYACIHSKTFLFDGEIVWLGSYNLDPRSANLNTEAGFVIRDKEFYQLVYSKIMRTASNDNSWTIGARRKIPIIAFFNSIIEDIFALIPFANLWPFTYSTSYELKTEGQEVPFYHDDFNDNYRPVGQFPGTGLTGKALKTRLTKAFFGPAQPII